MRFQSRKASCGPAAVANALECLGLIRTEDELATLCGQTPRGTTESGILNALSAVGLTPVAIAEKHADVAMLRLHFALQRGRPVILCVRSAEGPWDHWAVAAGFLGTSINVVDSGDNELFHCRTPEEVAAWWAGPENASRRYYGVIA